MDPANRIIAVGDIHGCATALESILEQIQPTHADTVVTLGDYVNRGPNTKKVIDLLRALRTKCNLVPLIGNHDEVLLDVIAGRTDKDLALRFGGQATLDSYNATRFEEIPSEDADFLRTCTPSFETEQHFFVHAGYEPNQRLVETSWNTLVWKPLEPPYPLPHFSGKCAVVGHTSQRGGDILDLGHITCIDTACCYGGVLTALDVTTGQLWQAAEPSLS
ncbi:MAG: metallophosphoesterase family protein [Pirellulales bacterium]